MCIRDSLKELLFKASELGVMIRFTPITEEHYQAWVPKVPTTFCVGSELNSAFPA